MRSLRSRILLTASLVLAVFLGCAGILLDRAFRETALTSVEDRLRGRIFMLIGAADFDAGAPVEMIDTLPDPALATPGSGNYARLVDTTSGASWMSRSALGVQLPPPRPTALGEWALGRARTAAGTELFVLTYGISWEGEGDRAPRRFSLEAYEDQALYSSMVTRFRRNLWTWFGGLSAALLLVQGLSLTRGLRPLADVGEEVRAVEHGRQEQIAGSYPAELSALTGNLNKLLRHQRNHLQRYRNALGDLAHAIKTPLAVLRSELDRDALPSKQQAVTLEQIERIDRTVQYHLQRAAAAGRSVMAPALAAAPVVERLVASLRKVYAGRGLAIRCALDPDVQFAGDEGDLMEIVGNLADNACKWARREVEVTLAAGAAGRALELAVRDDGPGIPAGNLEHILQRGARLDESVEGHGIGLAVVREMVEDVY
ncbi:MAG: ATP-binding protein, partial [Gammaproteobacteria bacterium]